jgi:2-dehydropantoate 2-reductase
MAFAVSTVDASVPQILADPRGEEVALAACSETAAVGSALGYDLQPIGAFNPEAFLPGPDRQRMGRDALAAFRDEMASSIKQHMGIWRDLKVKRRKTEVDVQCGEVVEHASSVGIDVPVNEMIVRVIHEIEDGQRDMGWENLDALRRAIPDSSGQSL